MSRRFRRVGRVLVRTWPDGAVVYHEPSGSTHQMEPLGAVILCAVNEEASSLDALCARLARELELPAGEDLDGCLAAWLAQFEKLGLVESLAA